MLDLFATHHRYKGQDISDNGKLQSGQNVADELTKSVNHEELRKFIISGKLRIKVEPGIICKHKDAHEEKPHRNTAALKAKARLLMTCIPTRTI